MYYMIRRRHAIGGRLTRKHRNGEVLAILCVREVIILDSGDNGRRRLVEIVEKDLNMDVENWYFHQIEQAEYETYRDLHGFHVITKTF